MANGGFEEKLNEKARLSSYKIKTQAESILAAAKIAPAKKGLLSSRLAKGWFFGCLTAIAASAIALAIYFPVSASEEANVLAPDGFLPANTAEPTETIITEKGETGVLSYELASFMPSLTASASSAPAASNRHGLSHDAFAKAVEAFEKMQGSAKEALVAASEFTATKGSYEGAFGSYPYCLAFASGPLFYFDYDAWGEGASSSAKGQIAAESFKGEFLIEAGVAYEIDGACLTRQKGQRDISLRLYLDKAAGDYLLAEQDSRKGSFYFSVSSYRATQFAFGYSAHLITAETSGATKKALDLAYADADGWDSASFRAYERDASSILIYLKGAADPIRLTYEGAMRRYVYGDETLSIGS
jgi:hypothetical protein